MYARGKRRWRSPCEAFSAEAWKLWSGSADYNGSMSRRSLDPRKTGSDACALPTKLMGASGPRRRRARRPCSVASAGALPHRRRVASKKVAGAARKCFGIATRCGLLTAAISSCEPRVHVSRRTDARAGGVAPVTLQDLSLGDAAGPPFHNSF